MNSLQFFLLAALVGFAATQWNLDCKIQVKFRNDGHKKVRVDLLVPSLSIMSDPVILNDWKQEKSVNIKGKNCEKKPWVFMVYGWQDGKWVLKKKTQSKFTGNGWFLTSVDDEYTLNVLDRQGIACSEGNCGK
ncbi:hypothetical protein CAEBREN_11065 [Caenorhabditis brenneri]|uniref:Uncharacterized protein n=1 Tax=Caenorhabditis brenneri TaxID=135651 RepID=G0M6X8_CAEBE|nr:hypothetical protein CAEBREN_11065 [Caenorhabditis brenneri]